MVSFYEVQKVPTVTLVQGYMSYVIQLKIIKNFTKMGLDWITCLFFFTTPCELDLNDLIHLSSYAVQQVGKWLGGGWGGRVVSAVIHGPND